MQERSEDLAALQGLLDRSYAAAGVVVARRCPRTDVRSRARSAPSCTEVGSTSVPIRMRSAPAAYAIEPGRLFAADMSAHADAR